MSNVYDSNGKPIETVHTLSEFNEDEAKKRREFELTWENKAREALYSSNIGSTIVTCAFNSMDRTAVIEIEEGGVITFDAMHKLSELFGTRLIDFGSNDDRFHGSDITGADPVLLTLTIRGINIIRGGDIK